MSLDVDVKFTEEDGSFLQSMLKNRVNNKLWIIITLNWTSKSYNFKMISSVGCKDSCWNLKLRQAVMLRLSTFASLVRSGYIAQNYFLFFAEAGFKLNHGMEIICVGCYIVHDIQDVRNDPSGTEYHHNSCKVITADSPILIENLDYSSLTGRLQSFKGIKLPYPLDALELATNYVYRTDPGLCLVCYFCKVKIRPTYNTNNLEQLVKDIQERRPIGCLCRQRTQSLSSVSVIHLESPAIDEYLHQSPAATASSVEDVILGFTYDAPTCPGSSTSNNETYYSFKKRLESLPKWSFTHTPEVMAMAGFFNAGYADCVRCFQRGLGLRSWKVGDEIYTEHSRYRPTCPFLQSVLSMENGANYQMCCFDCGLQFNLDDDPVTKHKERNSRCIFMQTVKSAHTVTSKNISHIK
ncbi:hypothetical protein Btru_000557 [Bulinus truncatus]|nr:hypothetical protein Btru_000557 [Bulinus truncatus]